MKRRDFMRFNEKVEDWLDAHSFSYLVRTKYVDNELSIFTFSIKEIPLITFSIWYTCSPIEDGQSTKTPQPFLFADFDYSNRKFNPSSAIYSPLYEKWCEEQKLITEQDIIDWLSDLMMIVRKPWIINEQEDVSQEYIYNLGRLVATTNYEEWSRNKLMSEMNSTYRGAFNYEY